MAPNPINIKSLTLFYTLLAVIGLETLGEWALQWTPLSLYVRLGIIRLTQICAMLWVVIHFENGLSPIGWAPHTWLRGIKIGAIWSLCFALLAGLGMVAIYLSGHNPLRLLRSPLPATTPVIVLYFFLGGLIAPLFEEICFRGILYNYFRRWGVIVAIVASTAIFVLLHFNQLPVTQIVGGLVFAVAYEIHRNLMVPITIHALGNTAIFTLSLPIFHT